MREVDVALIEQAVAALCIGTNRELPADLEALIRGVGNREALGLSREVLGDIADNLDAARSLTLPICQDTGMTVVFVRLGQEVHLTGGALRDAVNRGAARGCREGLLRASVVADPIRRGNTGDNSPAVLHVELVAGDEVEITVAPKGFGSENMSRVYMLTPSKGREGVLDSIEDAVRRAGSNPCPPVVVGVGIGGDFELCAFLAKKALCRAVSQPHADAYYAALEREALERVNALGIGAQGFGGATTALAVAVEVYPTHIAGLPVAVNMGCHVTRHGTVTL